MKQVFDNYQCAHVFAQQTQPRGRSTNGNVFFEGKTIYSYGCHFPMAHVIGDRVALINSDSYSISTNKQQGYVRGALRHYKCFYVNTKIISAFVDDRGITKRVKTLIIDDTLKEVQSLVDSAAKRRKNDLMRSDIGQAVYAIDASCELLNYFKQASPKKLLNLRDTLGGDIADIIDKAKALNLKQQAAIKRKAAALRKDWRNHKSNYTSRFDKEGIALRLSTDKTTVETSRGAKFPVTHAQKALRVICACRASNKDWHAVDNAKGIALGYFKIEAISASGDVKAGCHLVKYKEIAHLAKLIKNI